MVCFFLGVFVGVCAGVVILSIVKMGKLNERED